MLWKIGRIALALLAVSGLFGAVVLAQEGASGKDEATEAYMKMMAPNENHAYLGSFAGDWEITTTAWMEPGAEPSVTKGTGTGEMILGGRYLMINYRGTMFGQPFEGYQIVGYDNLKKKYVTLWIDSAGTGFYLTEGERDKAGTVLTEAGAWPDPMAGGTIKVRAITRIVSADEHTYEMYMTGADGKEFKSLENKAVRKKPEPDKQ
jgi:hypothetical protein